LFEGPLVLSPDFLFLLRREIILDVERLANLLRCLSFDHVSNSLTGQVQKTLDVQNTYQNKIKERGLVHFDKIRVEILEIVIRGRFVVRLGGRGGGRVHVALAVLDHLREDLTGDVRERDNVVGALVLNHVLNSLRLDSNRLFHLENLAIRAPQSYLLASVLRRRRRHHHDDSKIC
ncbi:ABC superfamily ATP binding cassette transporter, partial [Striga asiatica]